MAVATPIIERNTRVLPAVMLAMVSWASVDAVVWRPLLLAVEPQRHCIRDEGGIGVGLQGVPQEAA